MSFSFFLRVSKFLLVVITTLCGNLAAASDYGTTGLIDIPTARFDDDGVFAVAASTDERHKQFSITYQATPWLQGTFRYSGFNEFFHWDRNYEFKARLWEEELYLPQVAVGIRDLVGTGIFGSEYLVGSKRFGNTDVTLGVGWGRLAGEGLFSNPLLEINNRFATRDQFTGRGGELSYGQFFSGDDVGIFGGVSHKFESLPLTVMLEYNPDQYNWDVRKGATRPTKPWSMGVTWHALPDVDLRLSLQHGSEVGLGFRSYLSSKAELPGRESDQFISSYYLSKADLPSQINKNSWYDRLLYDVERSGLLLVEGTVSADGNQAKLVVGNTSYALWSDAVGRHTALADLHLPATVKSIHFVIEEGGHRSATIVVPRPSTSYSDNPRTNLNQVRILSGRTLDTPQHRTGFATGKINNTLNIRSRFQLFDPDDPARYQIFADLSSEFALSNHWAIRSSIAINLDHNFDESNRQESDSVLPKVRSDIVKYLNDGDSGLETLVVEGRDTYGRAVHYRAFGGYFETMYAGAGGELLYWPHKSRVAVGMSLAYVKQRDFDRKLGLLDYEVITGHVSAYWATPFYNYDLAIHAGQYLAKDLGATVEARRTFRNGWQIGVWATLTDVPFDDFGEGSFDKGFYFQVPLDGLFGSKTRSTVSTRMRPIQRDGGQRLEGYSGDIFWDLRAARYDAFVPDERLLP
ncbi:YjbH domain-containing protein [Luminiphilus sp.]|nr:YjbH domain-containing protein [Luminiphilus sp.]